MRKLVFTLPKYRLSVQYKITRRKAIVAEPIIPSVKTLKAKYRVGNLIQRFFRHVFENTKIKKLLGTNIALMLVASSFMPKTAILGTSVEASEDLVSTTINESETPLKTEIGTQYPVGSIRITQGYKFYHPGLDLDGVTGDTIKPIKRGKVVSIDYSRFAYGNSIIVDHGNKLTSLYAHLSKIDVKEGQEVATDTKLGEMGATGRSFGDHLHLEVRENGVPLNPLSVLPR